MSDIFSFMQMMGASDIPLIASFFIGLMAAISPCPLVTNITAIAYVSKDLKDKSKALLISLSYVFGRVVAYVILASLIIWFGISVPAIALGLQQYGTKILGPFLILAGLLMLNIFKIPSLSTNIKLDELKERLSKKGILGGVGLGMVFALAFCPFSAVLFFGMLVPLAINSRDAIVIPTIFGVATGLPVMLFALVMVYSISKLGTIMNIVQVFEKWMVRIVSFIFILVGIYYTLTVTFV